MQPETNQPPKRSRGRPKMAEDERKEKRSILMHPAAWAKLDQERGSVARGSFVEKLLDGGRKSRRNA